MHNSNSLPLARGRDAPPFVSTGPQGHRGRMRTRLLSAPDALADYEVLEMLLFFGIPRRDTKPLAKSLILQFSSLAGVLTAPADELEQAGLGPESVAALQLVVDAAEHLAAAENVERPLLDNFDRLTAYLDPPARSQRAAHLAVLFLNNRNELLAEQSWPVAAAVDSLPGQIARRALELHATALILVWCRPDREASRTKSDVALGRKIATAAEALSIVVHDNLVIGRGGDWISLRQIGGL
jgi:DNA repair protein RadC